MRWWRKLDDVDPITLEPISQLRCAPFKLGSHYFDGKALAAYVVASGSFVNPLTREALSRENCEALDAHIERAGLRLFVARHAAASHDATSRDATASAAAMSILESLFTSARSPSLREGLVAVYDSREDETPVARSDEMLFPALGNAPPPARVDWRSSIEETKRRDLERRLRRAEDARDAALAARVARRAATAAILGYVPPMPRLALVDEIVAAGAGARQRELRAEADAAWPDDLLQWATRDSKKVGVIEKLLHDLANDPRPASSRALPSQRKTGRRLAHAFAEAYGFETQSFDRSPERHVRVYKKPTIALRTPEICLTDAAKIVAAKVTAAGRRRREPRRPPIKDEPLVFQPGVVVPENDADQTPDDAVEQDAPEAVADDDALREAIRRSLEDCGGGLPKQSSRRARSKQNQSGDARWCVVGPKTGSKKGRGGSWVK
ncbi:hypothetical protein CTAYLR_010376 [Chrysophaeum taylorii]|uniref:R3H domain-containing protein n=1 Tax=Chrysophaeum taylorii TaxID=2483200 RepID=A0AAD7UJS4_9STRA|nr:hypothetical protein CTAYLR_010376 [Chrysophaeum taylorii]